MNDQNALRHWMKIEALDTRAVKRTIRVIRLLKSSGAFSAEAIGVEIADLCYWWESRRISRAAVRALVGKEVA